MNKTTQLRPYLSGVACALFALSACSDIPSKNEALAGTWVAYKTISYPKGKSLVKVPRALAEKMTTGSPEHPYSAAFTTRYEVIFSWKNQRPDLLCDYSFKGDSLLIHEPNRLSRALALTFLSTDTLQLTYELQVPADNPAAGKERWIVKDFYRRQPLSAE